jgi:predicted GTPase
MADPLSAALVAIGVSIAGGVGVKMTISFSKRVWQKLRRPTTPPAQLRHTPRGARLIVKARKTLGIDCEHKYNFAVCGSSGSGKSSLVNALRGVPDDPKDPRAALVDEAEATRKTRAYPCPEADHIVFWDLPGAGTHLHPDTGYFSAECLYAFDALIVVCDTRFGEVDLAIANEAVEWGVPVLFVRNKFDNAFQAYVKRNYSGKVLDERATRSVANQLVQNLASNIRQTMSHFPRLSSNKVYVLSAWAYRDDTVIAAEESLFVHHLAGLAALRAQVEK